MSRFYFVTMVTAVLLHISTMLAIESPAALVDYSCLHDVR